jgi:C1A family cysteine protease
MSTTTRAALTALALVALALAAPAVALAASLHSAPLEPALRADLSTGSAYVHSPVLVQRSHAALPLLREAISLPATYDLRAAAGVSHLTPVRDQGQTGTCWAFATVGALESALMPGRSWDFSEDNMVNRNGFTVDDPYQNGGSLEMGEAYLARWAGPVTETVDPFDKPGVNPAGPVRKHVQGFVLLSPRADFATDTTANDAIKAALLQYGAVATQMYFPESDRGNEYTATLGFYQATVPADTDGVPLVNHGVDIVGWDDAYAVSRFATPPPGPGAFLVRNSWGPSFGDGGYFWISYYDAALARSDDSLAFTRVDDPGAYDHAYGYDTLGWTSSAGMGSATARFANRFTAKRAGKVTAVSFYTDAPGATYRLYAGRSLAGLSARGAGTVSQAGYVTVPLSTRLSVVKGARFVVAVSLKTGTSTPIPLEAPISGYAPARASAGQSFVLMSGKWRDLTASRGYGNTNVCLKAFTVK